MTGKNSLSEIMWKASFLGAFLGLAAICSWGQAASIETQQAAQVDPTVRELAQQVRELRTAIEEMRTEAAAYRAETAELRRELEATREPKKEPAAEPATAAVEGNNLETRVAALEESSQLLNGKIDDQYQTKV